MSDQPRDCEHGQLVRVCRTCELEAEIARLVARQAQEIQDLRTERDEAQGGAILNQKALNNALRERGALREALVEAHALNVNVFSDAEPEMLAYYSEYKAAIAMGAAALALAETPTEKTL